MRPYSPRPIDSLPRNYDTTPWSYRVIDDVYVELANAIVKQAASLSGGLPTIWPLSGRW